MRLFCLLCMLLFFPSSYGQVSLVLSPTPSPNPTTPNTSTDPTSSGVDREGSTSSGMDTGNHTSPGVDDSGGENQPSSSQGVAVFAIAIPAISVGLVLTFSVVLLAIVCCLRHHRNQLSRDAADNTGGVYPSSNTIDVWSASSPPLPTGPRPNLHRLSQNSGDYMNEGEGPDKPYQSIPPYMIMASFPAHQHLRLPPAENHYLNSSAGHAYETVSDEEKISKAATPEEEYVLMSNGLAGNREGTDNEYVKMSSKVDATEDHNYVNSDEIRDSESAEKTSNNEYVIVPSTDQKPVSHPNYVNILTA